MPWIVWSRALSSSELNDHALHFESIGINDPGEVPNPLLGHWALNENITADAEDETDQTALSGARSVSSS